MDPADQTPRSHSEAVGVEHRGLNPTTKES